MTFKQKLKLVGLSLKETSELLGLKQNFVSQINTGYRVLLIDKAQILVNKFGYSCAYWMNSDKSIPVSRILINRGFTEIIKNQHYIKGTEAVFVGGGGKWKHTIDKNLIQWSKSISLLDLSLLKG